MVSPRPPQVPTVRRVLPVAFSDPEKLGTLGIVVQMLSGLSGTQFGCQSEVPHVEFQSPLKNVGFPGLPRDNESVWSLCTLAQNHINLVTRLYKKIRFIPATQFIRCPPSVVPLFVCLFSNPTREKRPSLMGELWLRELFVSPSRWPANLHGHRRRRRRIHFRYRKNHDDHDDNAAGRVPGRQYPLEHQVVFLF